jgi:hypothetical protein
MSRASRGALVRLVALGAVGLGIVIATFVYFLPTIANYGDVWAVVKTLSWPWIAALLVAETVNIATFAPLDDAPGPLVPPALRLTQASTALSWLCREARRGALSVRMLRGWGFATRDIARRDPDQPLEPVINLSFPIVAVFLLTISGESTATLATTFVGVAVLGVVVAGLVLVLVSDRRRTSATCLHASRTGRWAVRRGRLAGTVAASSGSDRERGTC